MTVVSGFLQNWRMLAIREGKKKPTELSEEEIIT
jgi:hypothetical protein